MKTKYTKEQIKAVDDIYNLSDGVILVNAFKTASKKYAKKFKKMSSSLNGGIEQERKIKKWIKKYIYPIWAKEVESKFWQEGEMDSYNEFDKLTYISGLFIAIHSTTLKDKIYNIIKTTLAEMTLEALAEKEKKEKNAEQ
jgi:hypothetical protein